MSSARKDALADVLDNVYTALDKSRGLLGIAPVPGLAAAVDLLLGILDQVKKMKANAETVEAVSREIQKLNDVIVEVIQRVDRRATRLRMKSEERQEMVEAFSASKEWRQRVAHLRNELEDLREKAVPCGQGPWHKRLLRSIRDEDTLNAIRADLARIVERYQLSGVLSIEALAEQSLVYVEKTYVEVKAMAMAHKAEAIKQQAEREQKIVDAIPHADTAGFKDASNTDKSYYLSGTRKVVFDRLEEWASSEKPVCFLVGAAGMGKSTIASEFCRRHEDKLGASFFFRRGDTGVGSTAMFFSSIAYQLAQLRPELRSYIAQAAQSHSRAGRSQRMQYAVADLLHEPLREATDAGLLSKSRAYIVVDALDECTESESQPDLVPECLHLLLSCVMAFPSFLRVLVTSRPQPDHIGAVLRRNSALRDASIQLSLYDVEERQAIDRDIGELIRTRLCAVEEGARWYRKDPSIVTRLTQQSDGVFVYARTAVDFIVRSAGIAQMKHRFQLLLTPGNTYGLGHLDLLYRTVLETAFPPADLDPVTRERIRLVLAWIALCQYRYGLTPRRVELISGIPCRELIPILAKLRSALVFDLGAEDVAGTRFRAMHVTFRDFLVDRARCGDVYHVDAPLMHARLAADCLKCVRDSPRRRLVFGSTNRVIYPVFNWVDHVVQASPTEELVGLLREIFTSVSAERAAIFFCQERFGGELRASTALLRWVDRHVGRNLAKVMGK
ncbi:hypothetical protein L226DRAFT_311000 [Lentinus tigrinus ALCF2SS1-7]|uniref:Nephrocystin 3-like N-terminal domain-containing protein n=1 Tax=Lentinus tigrinus ALCF2SS1-6 TaxID=1328759 RepID=A0A5C2S4W6_9APHY|nr:hypothetical protein L227DRAFT_175306 [Lentinus tigrinus ALCF2SS1-6]RPD68943.1 hypothetical protein L226DRAFT_311000 [Lentinus tigrinus ALCF2SS1-7]